MDEWHEIGSKLICTTCLGTEITGILVAFDIDKKLLFLKLEKNHENGILNEPLETHDDTNANSDNGDSSNHSYTLLNMSFISAIEEIQSGNVQVDEKLTNNSKEDLKNNTDFSENPGLSNSKKSKKSKKAIVELDTTRDKLVEEGLLPPLILNHERLNEKLKENNLIKMKTARLTKLGVTKNGFDLIKILKRTLGSKKGTVVWDKNGKIIVCDEVEISNPFTVESAKLISNKSNQQNLACLEHIKKTIAKFYSDQNAEVSSLENISSKHNPNDTQNILKNSSAKNSKS